MATGAAVVRAAGGRASFTLGAMRCLALAALAAAPVAARAVPPAAPVVTLSAGPKLLRLSWPKVINATAYKVLKDPTGSSGFTQLGADIPQVAGATVAWSAGIAVHKLSWAGALFQVQACNASGCTASASASPVGLMLAAVGYLKASNAGAADGFGRAVAVSADGNTVAVGAHGESSDAKGVNGNQASDALGASGAVYVFSRSALVWTQQAYLKAPNSAYADGFGGALSLSADGNRLAVGAPAHPGPAGPGMAYVFTRTGTTWAYEQDLGASNPENGDGFSQSVALSGDGNTLAVGAHGEAGSAGGVNGDQTSNSQPFAGAVYLFARSSGIWAQQAYVKAPAPVQYALFGLSTSLSTDGNTLAVGAPGGSFPVPLPGAVSVYTRSGTLWSWQATLGATAPAGGDSFGIGVSLSGLGNTLGVGASGDSGTGAAYVFARTGTSWSQQARLLSSNAAAGDAFGYAVALSADGLWLAAGAPLEDSAATGVAGDQLSNASASAGAAYVFASSGGAWSQSAYVKASNAGASDSFGWSVGLGDGGDQLVVGASGEDGLSYGVASGSLATNELAAGAGAAYLY